MPQQSDAAWQRIVALGSQLAEAIESGDEALASELAADRHRCVVRFFEDFPPQPDTAEQQLSLIRGLIASNERLAQSGRMRLAQVVGSSANTRHLQKAMNAYREQDSG